MDFVLSRNMILILVVLSFALEGFVFGAAVNNNNEGKHTGRVHHSQKVKIASSHGYEYSSDYGIELPNFAYDFSELFINGMITRVADSTDLYLNVMLLGHQTIYEDYPFDAINTDEKYFHAWKKASEHWPLENSTTESAHAKHQTKRSQYYCLIHNPVQEFETTSTKSGHHHISNTYQVHAQWLRINTDSSTEDQSTSTSTTSSIHRFYDVLRCKIRSSHLIYQHMSELVKRKRRLFVDIMHLSTEKADAKIDSPHTSSYAVILNQPTTTTHSKNGTSSPQPTTRVYQTTLISFNIPWNQRNIGFPMMHPLFSLMYDQLAVQKVIILGSSTSSNTVTTTAAATAAGGDEKRKNSAVTITNSKYFISSFCIFHVFFLHCRHCVYLYVCASRASISCHSMCEQCSSIVFRQSLCDSSSGHCHWSTKYSRNSDVIRIYPAFTALRSGSNCPRH